MTGTMRHNDAEATETWRSSCLRIRRLAGFGLAIAMSMALVAHSAAAEAGQATWDDYLDFAYVFSSSDAEQLAVRLYTESAWHALFAQTLFIVPSDEEFEANTSVFESSCV